MYLAMKLSESLMHLMSEAMCSMKLCKKIGWKLPLHNSGSVGVLGSYGNWMLMTLSLSSQEATAQGFGLFVMSCPAHSIWMGGHIVSILEPHVVQGLSHLTETK